MAAGWLGQDNPDSFTYETQRCAGQVGLLRQLADPRLRKGESHPDNHAAARPSSASTLRESARPDHPNTSSPLPACTLRCVAALRSHSAASLRRAEAASVRSRLCLSPLACSLKTQA